MSYPEYAALHFALPVGDDGAEAIAKFLDDHARIEPVRSLHRSDRRAWIFTREQFQAKCMARFASRARQLLRIGDQLRHSNALDVLKGFVQREHQCCGCGPGRFAIRCKFFLALEIEVEARQLRSLHVRPSLWADR